MFVFSWNPAIWVQVEDEDSFLPCILSPFNDSEHIKYLYSTLLCYQ